MDSRLHVLIVDVDLDTRDSLATILRLEGHATSVAADGLQAVRSLYQQCPDVVLLDICMPGMDGYEVGRQIKENRLTKQPFIIAVSGSPDDSFRREEVGIDLHLLKPIDLTQLRSLLGRFSRVLEEAENEQQGPLDRPAGVVNHSHPGSPAGEP